MKSSKVTDTLHENSFSYVYPYNENISAGQHLVIEMEGMKMGSLRVTQLLLERRKLEEKQHHGKKITILYWKVEVEYKECKPKWSGG